MTIFIGNLPFAATEEDLRALFQDYGTVVSIAIPVDRQNGRKRGFAFVALDSEQDEADAIRDLHASSFMGRTLRVSHDDRSGSRPAPRPQIRDQPVPAMGIELNPAGQDLGDSINVPMEYRAQVKGRCQRHFIFKQPNGATEWLDSHTYVREWRTACLPQHPYNQEDQKQALIAPAEAVADTHCNRTHRRFDVKTNWRVISNSGIDEGFIRPVIGPGGWPMIPGSSIKGLFKRACTNDVDCQRWCGGVLADQTMQAGILRFHGAWPKEANWGRTMLDIAHPQYNWQVGFQNGAENHNANAVISLFKPTLLLEISCAEGLEEEEWDRVRKTLTRALAMGLGGRTAAGYGHINSIDEVAIGKPDGDCLLRCFLEGQGSPSKRILGENGSIGRDEFRPTMFRASIRSMALRLFGGLTDANTALRTVGSLFGSIQPDEGLNLGLLTTAYTQATETIGWFQPHGTRGKRLPVFTTSGCLEWRMVSNHHVHVNQELLGDLLAALHGLTMALGGFGRGWRRPDHRIFYPSYYRQRRQNGTLIDKSLIGCHWEWRNLDSWEWCNSGSLRERVPIKTDQDLKNLIGFARQSASQWLIHRGACAGKTTAPWREIIHPERMKIWTRRAENTKGSMAIHWFHRPTDGRSAESARDLRKSDIAGRMGQVGCVWNRMLPVHCDESKLITAQGEVRMRHSPGPFLESLVLFPDACKSSSFEAEMEKNDGKDGEFKSLNFE